jgi:hypothetical protein
MVRMGHLGGSPARRKEPVTDISPGALTAPPVMPPGAPPTNVAGALNSVLKAAPEMGSSPGLAVGVASSGGDRTGRAQAVGHATNTISDSNAHGAVNTSVGGDLTNALDWFGNHVVSYAGDVGHDIVHGAEDVGSRIMNTLNKPMQLVQHE